MIEATDRSTRRRIWPYAVLFAVAVVGVGVALFMTCGNESPGNDRGIEKYAATFESPDELNNWKKTDTGKWYIKDGSLYGDARIPEQRSILWLDKPIGRDVQVEFEAQCLEKPGDINCFICGNGQNYSGYEVVVAGWDNSRIVIYKARAVGDPMERRRIGREPFEVEKGRTYQIKIRKEGSTFHIWVDGSLVITETDPDPPLIEGDLYFGLSTWENVVRFDNVKIEKKK